jgi:uncharacterized protein YfbU (UPF0304 family)
MELDEIKKEYYKILEILARSNGKTIEELDKEISGALEECKNVNDIMSRASEIFDE